MPTYEYNCKECNYTFETLQKITDSPLVKCSLCGKDSLTRGMGGGIGLSFQGSGFYITDYKKEPEPEPAAPVKASGSECKGSCE